MAVRLLTDIHAELEKLAGLQKIRVIINQDDIEERNLHVKKMGEIYNKAKVVRIWLGEETSGAERLAFDILDQISAFFAKMVDEGDFNDYERVKNIFFSDKGIKNIQWNCLSLVFNRAWVSLSNRISFHLILLEMQTLLTELCGYSVKLRAIKREI